MGIPVNSLNEFEINYLQSLPQNIPTVDWVWGEMNSIWDSYDLDNLQPLADQPVGKFYSHPVWLMNGVFTSVDPDSVNHREAIAR